MAYDIAEAFRRVEEELISSMIRNLKRHRAEETKEGFLWTQWQVEQLAALEEYRRRNRKKFSSEFSQIHKVVGNLINAAREEGNMHQEEEILKAIRDGAKLHKSPDTRMNARFFRMNDRKMNALIKATQDDFREGERAILRQADDQYRRVIFDAQVYANSGAATYEKAVDMATKDFLRAGIQCVEYSNGARHTLSDYADMAIRTAQKRAYLTGEGEKRQEWGTALVIMNKRTDACPKCLPFSGKVMIDDVWSGGKPDGKHMLISTAMERGLYHPRCRDSHTTYFPGISTAPDKGWTKEELEALEKDEKKRERLIYAVNQAEKYDRLARYSLDQENRREYEGRAEKWAQEKERARAYGSAPEYERNIDIDVCEKTDEIKNQISEIAFLKGFDNMPVNIQKEIAQGFAHMKKTFGERALPKICNASRMDAYGRTHLRLQKVMIRSNIEIGDAFSTICHECIHIYDYNRGLISERIVKNAIKSLGLKENSNKLDKLILDLLGWKLYNSYRNDFSEILAYAYEEYLFHSENALVNAIIAQLEKEML